MKASALAGAVVYSGCYSGYEERRSWGQWGDESADGGAGATEEDESGDGPAAAATDSRLPRLSHAQWEHTVRDLLHLDRVTGLSDNFIGDPSAGGFDNQGASYEVGATLWGDYQRAAEAVADRAVADSAILAAITPSEPGLSLREFAREFVERFGLRAYRRPLTGAELEIYTAAFVGARGDYDELDPFDAGVHLTIQMMLQSPYFLYRVVDTEAVVDGKSRLSGFERASRLSYALWNTMPDDELFAAASDGSLDTKEGVAAQAERMLAHPYARAMVEDFHAQLLDLDRYLDQYRNPEWYPDFDPRIGEVMQREVQMFIADVVFERREGYAELLTSTRTFANDELAPIYGLEANLGSRLVEVELDPTRRSGLLTRSGFLMSRSHQVDPDPIHRGAFISFELLCNLQPPIPDNVTSVEADPDKTNRERVDDHTGKGTCGEGCHTILINDVGFAFEHYDATGAWRDTDSGKPVDAAASFRLDGEVREYDDAVEFSQLMADSHQAHACYSRHLLEYVHGRKHRELDEEHITALAERSVEGELSIHDLVVEMVTSDEFLSLRDEEKSR